MNISRRTGEWMEEEGMIRGRMKPWMKIDEYNYKNELK